MQKMMAKLPEESEKKRMPLADKRNQTHKRMDRWIRLQQFVYGLPDDFSYALCVSESANEGEFESRALVRVGWMNWYGRGIGADRQHSLAVALLGTTEALSANSTASLLHKITRNRFSRLGRIGKIFRFGRAVKSETGLGGNKPSTAGELLAS